MPWAAKLGTKTVRFDDLPVGAWTRVHEEFGDWSEVYVAPLKNPAACLVVLEECVKVAEPEADPTKRVSELTPSMKALADLIVEADDDLPDVVVDGVPPKGADG